MHADMQQEGPKAPFAYVPLDHIDLGINVAAASGIASWCSADSPCSKDFAKEEAVSCWSGQLHALQISIAIAQAVP